MKIPEFDPQKWSDATQSLIASMARAKWLSGIQKVTLEGSDLSWSPLGKEQMNKAADALIKTAPDVFKTPDWTRLSPSDVAQPTPAQLGALLIELYSIIEPLQPPFTADESLVFWSFVTQFAREKAFKQLPPGETGPRFQM